MKDQDRITDLAGQISGQSVLEEVQELAPGAASATRSIVHSVVIKDEDLFFLTEPDGSVPIETAHGFGLYHNDCRYLNGYELRLGGKRPEELVWTADGGYLAVLGLTNPDIRAIGGHHIDKHSLEIKWVRMIDGARLALYDQITFGSLTARQMEFWTTLTFLASFEDVFAVRGMPQLLRGTIEPPVWIDDHLVFDYEGADGVFRRLSVEFSPAPHERDGATGAFRIRLNPQERCEIKVSIHVAESKDRSAVVGAAVPERDLKRVELALRRSREEWLGRDTQIRTDSLVLNHTMERSLVDLGMLRSHLEDREYFAAGVPWFTALFGRDSIITALQTLAYDPDIAEHTLRLLAEYQGTRHDEWREEEPGKILHELRVGEMANLDEIPHTPYYGTIDATPLFLILVGRHASWTGSLSLFNELRPNVESALGWITKYGDIDGDGYVEYVGNTGKGLLNQGWKDSGDAVVNTDGTLATPPIALVEVQAYVYYARIEMARLFRLAGEIDRAAELEREAARLRERFNRDYWVDKGYYALALQEGKRQAAVLSSNAGHALWSRIADPDRARQTAASLMGVDMFNGWGIRTLSEKEKYYNPLGYHLGTVWPHDNSMIVAGLRRYGEDEAALRVFVALIEAASHFDAHRLPELFAGFRRDDYGVPVSYPVACQPQAWAAGTVPYMLKTLLGLDPNGFENRLCIKRPLLPDFVNQVEIRNLRVGKSSVDLKFERTSDSIAVKVLNRDGRPDVVVEV